MRGRRSRGRLPLLPPRPATPEQTRRELTSDLATGLRQLRSVGARPRAWRAPWGCETAVTRRLAARHGLRLWGWNLDSHDWRGDSAERDAQGGRPQGGLRDGDVVLMHDGLGPGARRDGCAETLELTRRLIDEAERERPRAGAGLGVRGGAGVSSGAASSDVGALRGAPRPGARARSPPGPRSSIASRAFPPRPFTALAEAGCLEATIGAARAGALGPAGVGPAAPGRRRRRLGRAHPRRPPERGRAARSRGRAGATRAASWRGSRAAGDCSGSGGPIPAPGEGAAGAASRRRHATAPSCAGPRPSARAPAASTRRW